VLREDHRRFYDEPMAGVPLPLLIEQPSNRGTAAAIAYALSRMARLDEEAIVGFFPADHHYANTDAVRRAVDAAYLAAAASPDRVFLVGAEANWPDTQYGWIEPGGPETDVELPIGQRVSSVLRFWEKPAPLVAHELWERRCLWNTFVMVGTLRAFRELVMATLPALGEAFEAVVADHSMVTEQGLCRELYDGLPEVDFCGDILAHTPDRLGVIRMVGAGWTDLGQPDRLAALLSAQPIVA